MTIETPNNSILPPSESFDGEKWRYIFLESEYFEEEGRIEVPCDIIQTPPRPTKQATAIYEVYQTDSFGAISLRVDDGKIKDVTFKKEDDEYLSCRLQEIKID